MAKEPKKTAVTDPLEASKIPTKPAPPSAPQPPAPVELAKPSGEVEPHHPRPKQYRVVTDTTISLNGQLVKLNKDDLVSEANYGPVGMMRIMESNVPLVEMKDG